MPESSSSTSSPLVRLLEPARRNVEFYQQRRMLIGWIAIVAFPLYYVIWRYVYPQPYENLGLRLAGVALFLSLMLSERWPAAWRRFLPSMWYLAFLYSLPFFFTFMALMNRASPVWVESLLVAIFAMMLALDALTMLVLFVLGTGGAVAAYLAVSEAPAAISLYGDHLLVILFAVVFGSAANFASQRLRAGQERAMLATAASVAHELRTPLLAIKAGAGGLRNHLPLLIEAYALARAQALPVPAIRDAHLESLRGVLDRIEREADYSNAIIDMLMQNVRGVGDASPPAGRCDMRECVESALQRYPFAGHERELVRIEGESFVFRGDGLLVVHVLFNLVKNALRHMARAGRGEIAIRLVPGGAGAGHRLLFRDTGSGIPAAELPHIFERFYSGREGDGVLGSGIGLAFCRDVMRAMGGRIACRSVDGEWTEFELEFPVP